MSAAPTQAVSVDTEDLAYFVDRGRQYANTLDALLEDVRRLRLEVLAEVRSAGSAGPSSISSVPSFQNFVAEVRANNAFVERLHSVMKGTAMSGSVIGGTGAELASSCRPPLGELVTATDADRNQVLAAMVAGLTPDEIDLHWSLLPPDYRRYQALGRHIEAVEQEREVADGSSWSPWDGDDDALASIDGRLAVLRQQRSELAQQLGMGSASDGGDGAVDRFGAIAAISEATGGGGWEGALYADHFVGFHEGKISGGDWLLGIGGGDFEDPSGNDVELRHIGSRIASRPEAALAFFNGIGVARTADLPTFLVGNDLSVDEFNNYGLALGAASRAVTPSGEPALEFSGEALVTHEKRDTQNRVIWYSPALLFATGDFESSFLADATVAVLRLADAGDELGRYTHMGYEQLGVVPVSFNGGEDPRNIMLDRSFGDREAVHQIITDLGAVNGRHWQAGPGSSSLDPLLKPSDSFDATIGPDPDIYWLDKLLDLGNVANPGHPSLSPIGYPALRSEYPITAFLGAVGQEDGLSRWVLRYTANSVATEGLMVKDPGTAAGLDLIMANHASLMFDRADLAAVGIERTGINDGARAPVQAEHWKAVHGEILRLGRGQALALSVDRLLDNALVGAIDDSGQLDHESVKPFAHMAGRTEIEASQALFAYSAELDEKARKKNRTINVAVSAGLGVAGIPLGPAGAAVATTADVGWTAFFKGYPDDQEVSALRDAWEENVSVSRSEQWKDLAARRWYEIVASQPRQGGSGTMPMFVPGIGWSDVAIELENHPVRGISYRWRHPETWASTALAHPSDGSFAIYFPPSDGIPNPMQSIAYAVSLAADENFQDGRIRSLGLESFSAAERRDALADTAWTVDWIAQP